MISTGKPECIGALCDILGNQGASSNARSFKIVKCQATVETITLNVDHSFDRYET